MFRHIFYVWTEIIYLSKLVIRNLNLFYYFVITLK